MLSFQSKNQLILFSLILTLIGAVVLLNFRQYVRQMYRNNATQHLKQAKVHLASRNYVKSLLHSDCALEWDKEFVEGHFYAGLSYYHLDRYPDQALEYFRKAIRLKWKADKTEYYEARLYSGLVLLQLGKRSEAKAALIIASESPDKTISREAQKVLSIR